MYFENSIKEVYYHYFECVISVLKTMQRISALFKTSLPLGFCKGISFALPLAHSHALITQEEKKLKVQYMVCIFLGSFLGAEIKIPILAHSEAHSEDFLCQGSLSNV